MAHPSSPDHYLFRTPHGSIYRCPCCGDYEVRFHNAVLTVSRLELGELYETIAAVCEVGQSGPAGWQLRARTARQAATFYLWGDDAEELADLLGGATAMLALDALLAETLGLHLTATT